jgi:dipeptidyl aminopeptidase/acylaminoacyl peptidase
LLTAHEGDESNEAAAFTPDGDLLLLTDRDSEFVHLVRLDLADDTRELVFQPAWDIMYAGYSRAGKYFLAAVNADARTELKLFNAADFSPVELPSLPAGDLNQIVFSADDGQLAMYVGDSRTPSDLYVLDLAGGGTPQRLVTSLNPAIDREHLVDGKVTRFTAADGVEIPGLLYLPHEARSDNKVPGLVWVHGGPGGQSRLNYSGLMQYLINHGYAVYAINNRGSSGYGKTFFGLDDQRHGEADLADVVQSKQFLIDSGVIDPERIGIMGGSYGGYMVLAALAFEPEVFDVGVNIFGVSNWLRTLTSIPPWWESFRLALYAEMGDPSTDEERLRRISPLFHAERIVKPLIVLQGANDPRVLQVESDEIVAAVKANGVPVEYLVFPDEGHGFVNRANEIKGYRAIKEFLDQHLRQ